MRGFIRQIKDDTTDNPDNHELCFCESECSYLGRELGLNNVELWQEDPEDLSSFFGECGKPSEGLELLNLGGGPAG